MTDHRDATTALVTIDQSSADQVSTDLLSVEPRSAPTATVDGPRIRWAGIIWGLAMAITGFLALRMLLTSAARDAFYEWAVTLTPLTVVACILLALGGVLVVTGLVGLARRLQRASATRRGDAKERVEDIIGAL